MSIDIGIIGLPQSGKTSVFDALTGCKTAARPAEAAAAHVAVVKVPEPRLQILADMFNPRKVVPVEAKYLDIGASVKSPGQDKGFGGQLLNQLSTVDTLFAVVRAFESDSIPHPEGSLDIHRDIATLNLELAFSDLAIIERRLERIENSMKAAKPQERQGLLRETELLKSFQAELEKDVPLRDMELDAAQTKLVANYQFLTAKPLLLVINIGEEQLPQASEMEAELNARYGGPKRRAGALCGKLEMELAQMEDCEAVEFRADYGLETSGLERSIQLAYEISEMICFFTVGEDECRAWPIKKDTPALRAAGKIHSDIEKGFIRAEIVSYDELIRCGGLAEAKQQGKLRLEGKEYVVKDGDVINFLFNV